MIFCFESLTGGLSHHVISLEASSFYVMGTTNPKPDHGGDIEFMEKRHSGSSAYVRRWNVKYGFNGSLTIENCEALLENVLLRHKEKMAEYEEEARVCELWLAEAKLRNMQMKHMQTDKVHDDDTVVYVSDDHVMTVTRCEEGGQYQDPPLTTPCTLVVPPALPVALAVARVERTPVPFPLYSHNVLKGVMTLEVNSATPTMSRTNTRSQSSVVENYSQTADRDLLDDFRALSFPKTENPVRGSRAQRRGRGRGHLGCMGERRKYNLCFACGMTGHWARDCSLDKKN